jgi:hypothetical protein
MPIRCTDIETLVQTYLDDELADGETRELELHLGMCASCRRHAASAARFHSHLRTQLAPPSAPAEFGQRIALALDQEDWNLRRAQPRRSWMLPGAATMAAAAALLLFVMRSVPMTQTAASPAVAEDAVRELISRPPLEVQGAAVRPWVNEQHPAAQMPEFEGLRSVLRGGRLSQIRDRRAVQIYYDVLHGQRRHEVSVHLFDARDIDFASGFPNSRLQTVGGRELWVGELRGYAVVAHRDRDGTGYLFTSPDLSGDHLLDIVSRAKLIGRR